jgi:DNA-binding HxlR family transcriptional regulator
MLGKDYRGQVCSVAGTLEIVGERWTLLVLRDVFLGVRRFDDLQQDLGVARNVLATRLDGLVAAGILERVRYQDRPLRHEYRLTEKGVELWPVIVEIMLWGDRHLAASGGPPLVLRHRGCGGTLVQRRLCSKCGAGLDIRDVAAEPGPGATGRGPLRLRRRSDDAVETAATPPGGSDRRSAATTTR